MSVEAAPAGWVFSPISEIAEVNPSKVVPSCSLETPVNFVPMAAVTEEFGGIDLSAKRPLKEVQKGYTQFCENDVIVAKITPCMENGKLAVVPALDSEVAYGSTEFHVVRAKEDLLPDWIAYFVAQSSFRRAAQRNMSGSAGQLRVPAKWLEEQMVPVAPANEQKRITAKIEELFSDLDASVAALERARVNLKRYRAAVLKAAVEGRLTAAWRKAHPKTEHASKLLARILAERRRKWEQTQLAKFAAAGKAPPKGWKDKYPEPAHPDTANLPELPEGWCWATVDQVSLLQRYGSSAKTSEEIDGVPVLRMGNIQDGNLDLEKLKYLPDDHHEFPDLLLKKGDLLFNRTNSAELVGKTAVYKGLPERCSFASYLIGVRLIGGSLPDYVSYFINSLHGRRWVGSVVSQQVGQANVNGTKLAALTFPLPPENEQRAIVLLVEEKLSIAEKAILELERNQERADRLHQSILKRAFEGKLVPQDPNDEPASALLARIRAARAKDAAKPKPAGRRGRPAKARA